MVKKSINPECAAIRQAFEQSLDILGERGKKILLSDLSGTLHISIKDDHCPTVEEIERALEGLFGEGASLIMTRMQSIIDSSKS
jgi:hypothetical protein